jgi:hypothetical protein
MPTVKFFHCVERYEVTRLCLVRMALTSRPELKEQETNDWGSTDLGRHEQRVLLLINDVAGQAVTDRPHPSGLLRQASGM